MIKKLSCLLFMGLGLFLSESSCASTQEVKGLVLMPNAEQHLIDTLNQLNLTDTQKKEVSAFMRHIEPAFLPNIEQYKINERALEAMSEKNYDAQKISVLADKQGRVVANIIKLRMEVRHKIYSILTVSQRIKLVIITKTK